MCLVLRCPALFYAALPCHASSGSAFSCIAPPMRSVALPCSALALATQFHRFCPALPRPISAAIPSLAIPCITLLYLSLKISCCLVVPPILALPCPSLRSAALPCNSLRCPIMSCSALLVLPPLVPPFAVIPCFALDRLALPGKRLSAAEPCRAQPY